MTRPLMRSLPILRRMDTVDGWLTPAEADLLIAGAVRALRSLPSHEAIVEIGSHCGRATIVLASVAKALEPRARVYAIDPHDGVVGARDDRLLRTGPTFAPFRRNVADAGVDDVVVALRRRPEDVHLEVPIAFLLVDGLHDYASVASDFLHFEPHLAERAHVAFHDYADYFPGVMAFVDELVLSGRYAAVRRVESMILLSRIG